MGEYIRLTVTAAVVREYIKPTLEVSPLTVASLCLFFQNIFQTWALTGEVIGHNEVWQETYTPIINNQKGIIFEFFR